MRRPLLVALLAAVSASVPAAPQAFAGPSEPVLGSPDYLSGPYGEGWGRYAPRRVFNGGVPSGLVDRIAWKRWGKPVARGRGRGSIYRPSGGYYPRVRLPLRARRLGTCPGHAERAYTILEFRSPNWPGGPLGPWLKWSGSKTICDYDEQDPRYEYPHRPPGVCGTVGKGFGKPGTMQDIQAYRLSCRTARQVGRRVAKRAWPSRCFTSGCRARIRGVRCRLYALREDETTGLQGRAAQRVACRRGRGTMSGWSVP